MRLLVYDRPPPHVLANIAAGGAHLARLKDEDQAEIRTQHSTRIRSFHVLALLCQGGGCGMKIAMPHTLGTNAMAHTHESDKYGQRSVHNIESDLIDSVVPQGIAYTILLFYRRIWC